MSKSKAQNVLAIPAPGQGHINSLLHVSYKLVSSGFNIIFVNIDYCHQKIVEAAAAASDQKNGLFGKISFVPLQDGMDSEAYQSGVGKFLEAMFNIFPSKLERLINKFNSESENGEISCVLADACMAWTLEVAHKLGIRGALHWPMAAANLVLQIKWPELLENGIIDSDGTPLKNEKIQLYPGMPVIEPTELTWYANGISPEDRRLIFKFYTRYIECLKLSDWCLCNSVLELEPESFALFPKLRPIGPLISTSTLEGQFWLEDFSCLPWLDEQKPKSVIYISFGSLAIFNLEQFQELAMAVDALDRPVLWVVRANFTNGLKMEFPDQFQGKNTKIVRWAPQIKVLSHPAIACFVSHCGWNSVMEGVANGVPFLCWPYFADQFLNKSCVCDTWKVGLSVEKNENGMVTRDELREKVDKLLGDEGIQERASSLEETTMRNVAEGGISSRNLESFITWLKTSNSLYV